MIKCNECGYEGNPQEVKPTEKSGFECEVCPNCKGYNYEVYIVDGHTVSPNRLQQLNVSGAQVNYAIDQSI